MLPRKIKKDRKDVKYNNQAKKFLVRVNTTKPEWWWHQMSIPDKWHHLGFKQLDSNGCEDTTTTPFRIIVYMYACVHQVRYLVLNFTASMYNNHIKWFYRTSLKGNLTDFIQTSQLKGTKAPTMPLIMCRMHINYFNWCLRLTWLLVQTSRLSKNNKNICLEYMHLYWPYPLQELWTLDSSDATSQVTGTTAPSWIPEIIEVYKHVQWQYSKVPGMLAPSATSFNPNSMRSVIYV